MSSERQVFGSDAIDRIKETIDAEARPDGRTRQLIPPGAVDRPVIGLVVSDDDADAVAGTVLRANRAGFHVLVTTAGTPEVDGLEFARDLGATVVEPGYESGDPIQRLYTAARNLGFPGLLYQDDFRRRIDFEASEAALLDSNNYGQEAIAAVAAPDRAHPGDELLIPHDSDARPTISVVLPTLDEEEGITESIERVKNALVELDVTGEIIVSDSSTDRTPEIARSLGAHVVHPDKPGYGYAYRYAFEHVRGDYVVIGDADCTYDFEELPKLYALVAEDDGYRRDGGFESADLVMGSRFQGEIKPGAMPALHRYVGNPLLTKFLNTFYGAGVSDAHSGFRVMRRDVLDKLDLDSDGMEFASEMVMDAAARGMEIVEVPITYHEREGEATLSSFEDGWRHVKFMLLNAPGYLFSVPGVVLTLLGVIVMGMAFFGVRLGSIGFGAHSMIAGSLLTIVGYQVASLGVFATVAGNPIRKPQDAVTEGLLAHVSLERGATVGLVSFALGGSYATVMVVQWVQSGFNQLPFLMGDVVAFTAIVLGVQTVFGSFFMSIVASET